MKNKKPFRISSITAVCICILACILVRLQKDNIVISYGIRRYKGFIIMSNTLLVCSLIFFAAGVALKIAGNIRKAKEKKAEELVTRDAEGVLDFKSMDGNELARLLIQNRDRKWKDLSDPISRILYQMKTMDGYQKSLSKLLKENDAAALGDTEELLSKVEQDMFKNIRAVLNFMNIADVSDEKKVKEEAEKCLEHNGDLLRKTKDFLYALTDYLNGQGSDTASEMLDTYKETILKTLKGGED